MHTIYIYIHHNIRALTLYLPWIYLSISLLNVCSLVRYIRDEGAEIGLPEMPGGLVMFSPWCDLTFSLMNISHLSGHTNRHSDIVRMVQDLLLFLRSFSNVVKNDLRLVAS